MTQHRHPDPLPRAARLDAERADRIARELAGQPAGEPRRRRTYSTSPPPVPPGQRTDLLTHEVADILHVSPKTVSRWAKDGKLPFQRTMGGHRRYPEAEIRKLAEDLTETPTAPGDEDERDV
jgi:excisionase family DNA binding protein